MKEEKKSYKSKMPYIPKTFIHYRTLPFDSTKDKSKSFVEDAKELDKFIRFQMKSDYIKIGYDIDTCNDLLNTDIKQLLYSYSTKRSRLKVEQNFWYVYKYEGAEKLLKALKIYTNSNFQVIVKPKLIEIKRIYTSKLKHSGYKEINPYFNYKFPTRIFEYRLFNIVPISDKEYQRLKDIKQPFYIVNKQIISIQ